MKKIELPAESQHCKAKPVKLIQRQVFHTILPTLVHQMRGGVLMKMKGKTKIYSGQAIDRNSQCVCLRDAENSQTTLARVEDENFHS